MEIFGIANSYGIDVWDIKSKEISYTFVPSKTMNNFSHFFRKRIFISKLWKSINAVLFLSVVDIEEEGIMKPVRIIPNPQNQKLT
jgi:hypothetical protein